MTQQITEGTPIKPIQFLTVGEKERVPAPLIRITTCGLLTVEIAEEIVSLDPPQAHYTSLTPEQLQGRGIGPALTILKLLLSRPERFATHEWLMEQFGRDGEQLSSKRIYDLVSLLRNVLCSSALPVAHDLRMQLVARVRSSNCDGYQLASHPLIWVDQDALAWNVEQATRMERFNDTALPFWERAYELARRGPYLPDERYADWATFRREQVTGMLRQSVQALARLYQEQHGAAGEEEALRLLRTYWLEHPHEEDVLRPLMELLGKRECIHEAFEYYEQLCRVLEEDEREPDSQTQDVATFLRNKQLTRRATPSSVLQEVWPLEMNEAQESPSHHPPLSSNLTIVDALPVALEPGHRHEQTQQQEPPLFPPIWNVPYLRNPFFTGREEVLTHLYEVFCASKTTIAVTQHALSGLGGIGKTQIALEYAYRYGHKYQAVFWVRADTRETLYTDFLSLAGLLHLPEQTNRDAAITILVVKQWLRSHNQWLMIFDNADDLSLVREYVPPGHQGHILLTTRAQALGGLAHRIDVEAMNPETGASFLLRRAGLIASDASFSEDASYPLAKSLVQELGGLPLALDQAAAYIEETAFDLQSYLLAYQTHRHMLLCRRGGLTADHPESVATTWSLSLNLVQQSNPLAVDLLRLCAFLDPDVIPEEILLAGLAEYFSLDTPDQARSLQLNEVLSILLRFSLIRCNKETRTITIHRLVQAIIQDSMNKEMQSQWALKAIQAVQCVFPQPSAVYSAAGYPHAAIQLLNASVYMYQEQNEKKELAATLWKLAVQQQVIGHLREAERNLTKGLTVCSEIGDQFHEAKTHQYFALLRTYQGLYHDAFSHLEKALALCTPSDSQEGEGSIYAYYTLCHLHANEMGPALIAARKARTLAVVDRDIIRAEWLLGWTCLQHVLHDSSSRNWLQETEFHLNKALSCCRQCGIVDYEADILLAWAQYFSLKGEEQQAEKHAKEAYTLANKSAFNLLQADIGNFLARFYLARGTYTQAKGYASLARQYASGDGAPYYYKSAFLESERLLAEILHQSPC